MVEESENELCNTTFLWLDMGMQALFGYLTKRVACHSDCKSFDIDLSRFRCKTGFGLEV